MVPLRLPHWPQRVVPARVTNRAGAALPHSWGGDTLCRGPSSTSAAVPRPEAEGGTTVFASAEDHRGRGPPRSRLVFLFAHELISRSGVGSCNSRHSVVLARAKIRVPWRGCWMPPAVVACRRPSPYLVGRPPRNNGCATRPIRRSSRRSCAEDRLDDRSRQAGRSSPPFWTNIRLAVLADLAHGGKGRTLPNRDA